MLLIPIDILYDLLSYADVRTISRALCSCKAMYGFRRHGQVYRHVYEMLGVSTQYRFSVLRAIVRVLLNGNVNAVHFDSIFARVVAVYTTGEVETGCGHVLNRYGGVFDSCTDDTGDVIIAATNGVYSMARMTLIAPAAGRIALNSSDGRLVTVGFDRILRSCSEENGFYPYPPGYFAHMHYSDGQMIVLRGGVMVAQIGPDVVSMLGVKVIRTLGTNVVWIVGPFADDTFIMVTSDEKATLYSSLGCALRWAYWPAAVATLSRPVLIGQCAFVGSSFLHIPSMCILQLM